MQHNRFQKIREYGKSCLQGFLGLAFLTFSSGFNMKRKKQIAIFNSPGLLFRKFASFHLHAMRNKIFLHRF